MKRWIRIAFWIAAALLYVGAGWIAGLALLLVGAVALGRRLLRARRALAPTTRCPWCGMDVAQYGSFECASCRARTRGWAWRCAVCRAWAGHVACTRCGLSVSNPLLGGAR